MSLTRSKNPARQDKFTYRTTIERDRKIRLHSADVDATFEEVLDLAVDRYFRDQKTADTHALRNPKEIAYTAKLLRFLRDPKPVPGYRAVLDFLLTKY